MGSLMTSAGTGFTAQAARDANIFGRGNIREGVVRDRAIRFLTSNIDPITGFDAPRNPSAPANTLVIQDPNQYLNNSRRQSLIALPTNPNPSEASIRRAAEGLVELGVFGRARQGFTAAENKRLAEIRNSDDFTTKNISNIGQTLMPTFSSKFYTDVFNVDLGVGDPSQTTSSKDLRLARSTSPALNTQSPSRARAQGSKDVATTRSFAESINLGGTRRNRGIVTASKTLLGE